MLAHIDDLYQTGQNLLPWMTFLIGLSGSLHCAGMCGGLVISSCGNKTQMAQYQLGRMISYVGLGVVAAYFGQVISITPQNTLIALLPALAMGLMLIAVGLKNLSGTRPEMPMPKWMHKSLARIWSALIPRKQRRQGVAPFLTGALSIFLPCGLLYAVALALISFKSPVISAISMFSFWLGGVPALVLTPQIIRKVLRPISQRLPLLSSLSLICVGLITIGYRLATIYQAQAHSCH